MPIKLLYTFLFYFVILTAQGNVLAVYEHKHAEGESGTFTLAEQHLYGASRIGMTKPNLALNTTTPATSSPTIHYELTNHLGNVMAVITDEPATTETPMVESLTDYYPFGMTMPGRSYNAHTLRHGFTGHEKESDLAEGIYTTEYRLYDARVGRWLSVDPLFKKYVGMSPYNYCAGNPVKLVDVDGRDWIVAEYEGETFIYFDENIKSQEDIVQQYYGGEDRASYDIEYLGEISVFASSDDGTFELNSDGSYIHNGSKRTDEYSNDGSLHVGSSVYTTFPNEGKQSNNWCGNYLGPNNPTQGENNPAYSYAIPPIDDLDYAAFLHDKGYDRNGANGPTDAVLNPFVLKSDIDLVIRSSIIYTSKEASFYKRFVSGTTADVFFILSLNKSVFMNNYQKAIENKNR